MKLQLDESTLNAYINEAIKQEMNEGWEKLGKFGGKAKNILKGTTKGVKNYGKALGGNKKAIKKANSKISDIDTELKKIHSAQDANIKAQANVPDWDKNLRDKLGKEGWSLVDQERALTKGKNALTTKLNQAKAGKTLARTATGAAVAGLGAGYLAGRSRNGGQDPNAPWNDENNDPGMNDDVQNDTGGNEINGGGFDGTFPWDDIEPQWTPRRPRPQVQQPTQPVQPQQPAQPARTRIEPLASVQAPANLPTGAVPNQAGQTIQRNYAPGTNPANVNKWNNTANFRKMSGQAERGVAPEKIAGTVQNRRARQEKRYDKINAASDSQNQGSVQ